jgi:flagellar biogenesis protein FliO
MLVVLVGTGSASAGIEATPPAVQLAGPSLFFSLVRVFGALALVFALFLAAIWFFRNWQRLTLARGTAPRLNVLEVKSLGPRHALYVVGYEEQRFLLSSAPGGVALLTSLPPATVDRAEISTVPPQPNFLELFLKAVARK